MAMTTVPEIIANGAPRQEPPHDVGPRCGVGSEQKVKAVGNQCPGITGCFGLSQNAAETIEGIVPLAISKKDLQPSYSSPYDRMHASRAPILVFLGMDAPYHIHPRNQVIILCPLPFPGCGSPACQDLCGGCRATGISTATLINMLGTFSFF
jgi:hypothetical protein